MGGSGSGRLGRRRRKVEQMLRLDIAQLQRQGLFLAVAMQVSWPSGGSISVARTPGGRIQLKYRHRLHPDDQWHEVEELVPVARTPQRFGGERVWFRCPRCDWRVRILYAPPKFLCRHCHRLFYTSQSEGKADRATRGMMKIVKRLDPEAVCNHLPPRPPHTESMHVREAGRAIRDLR